MRLKKEDKHCPVFYIEIISSKNLQDKYKKHFKKLSLYSVCFCIVFCVHLKAKKKIEIRFTPNQKGMKGRTFESFIYFRFLCYGVMCSRKFQISYRILLR